MEKSRKSLRGVKIIQQTDMKRIEKRQEKKRTEPRYYSVLYAQPLGGECRRIRSPRSFAASDFEGSLGCTRPRLDYIAQWL